MYAPKRVWRRWTRKTNLNKRRFAVASSVAATALTSLVQARGHRVNHLKELPLVVDLDVKVDKTKKAQELFKKLGLLDDVDASKDSKRIRSGIGKIRNRRFKQKTGPLVVHNGELEHLRAFRNLPGVEFSNVNSLSILKLAPGGHLGRLCVWTKSAFEHLNGLFGTNTSVSNRLRNGKHWVLPRSCISNTDVESILTSDNIYNVLNNLPKVDVLKVKKGNPTKNNKLMSTLNPWLAHNEETRNKKKSEWNKSLESKRKTLNELLKKRRNKLSNELKELYNKDDWKIW